MVVTFLARMLQYSKKIDHENIESGEGKCDFMLLRF